MNDIHFALLQLIKASLFKEEAKLPVDTDFEAIYKEACEQTVAALASPAIPPENAAVWQTAAFQNEAQYMRMLYEQSNLIKLFNDSNIPIVIIKGFAAAIYYPKPQLRTMGDIDFLVGEKNFEAAHELLTNNGYTFLGDYEDGRDYTYQKGGVIFELHRRYSDSRLDIEDILINGMNNLQIHELNGNKFPTFSEEINGLILLDHIRHHLYGGLGIRQIIDWMVFLNANSDNGESIARLLKLISEANLEKFAEILTKMCVLYFGLPDKFLWCREADSGAAEELLNAVFKSGNFGRKDPYVYKPLDSLTQSIRKDGLFRVLQNAGLENWNACQKHRFLRPFAWIYQSFRFIKRGILALLRGENFKKDIEAGNEKMDFYEKLGI